VRAGLSLRVTGPKLILLALMLVSAAMLTPAVAKTSSCVAGSASLGGSRVDS